MTDAPPPILADEDLHELAELASFDDRPARIVRAEVCARHSGTRIAAVHAAVLGAPDRLVIAYARPGDAWREITTVRRHDELVQLARVLRGVLAAREVRRG